MKIFAVAKSSVLFAPSKFSEAESSFLSSHHTALNSPAALLGRRAGDARVRRGESNICLCRDDDVHSVDRQARGISRTGSNLFVDDDGSSTRQANRLIRKRGYHDKHTVDAQVVYHHSSITNWWSIFYTRALRTRRYKIRGYDVATRRQIQIGDNGLRPALVKASLSDCVKSPSGEQASK